MSIKYRESMDINWKLWTKFYFTRFWFTICGQKTENCGQDIDESESQHIKDPQPWQLLSKDPWQIIVDKTLMNSPKANLELIHGESRAHPRTETLSNYPWRLRPYTSLVPLLTVHTQSIHVHTQPIHASVSTHSPSTHHPFNPPESTLYSSN